MNGARKPTLKEMPRADLRLTFLYLEHCKIRCEDFAAKVVDKSEIYLIPSNLLSM